MVMPIPGVAKAPIAGAALGGSIDPDVGDPANELVMDIALEFAPEICFGEDDLEIAGCRVTDELRRSGPRRSSASVSAIAAPSSSGAALGS